MEIGGKIFGTTMPKNHVNDSFSDWEARRTLRAGREQGTLHKGGGTKAAARAKSEVHNRGHDVAELKSEKLSGRIGSN